MSLTRPLTHDAGPARRGAVARPAGGRATDPAAVAKAYAARRRPRGSSPSAARFSWSPPTTRPGARSPPAATRGDGRPALPARPAGGGADHPEVDGVLGTPDVVEELLLLGALEGKVVIGSMNRGGLDGATWTMDDRFTGYDAASIAASGSRAARCCCASTTRTPAPPRRSRRCAEAVSELAAHGLMAMVEPLPYERDDDGTLRPAQDTAVPGPRRHGRVGAGHDERIHLAEDAVLRRAGGGLRRDHAALRRARRRARPRPGRRPGVVGADADAPGRARPGRRPGLLYPPDGDVGAAVDGRRRRCSGAAERAG